MWTMPTTPQKPRHTRALTVELIHTPQSSFPPITLETARAALEQACAREMVWLAYEVDLRKAQIDLLASLRGLLVMFWSKWALQGQTAQDAFFIRSSPLTMPQNDTDKGISICEVGMAPVKPGEFVVFRISFHLTHQ